MWPIDMVSEYEIVCGDETPTIDLPVKSVICLSVSVENRKSISV